MSKLTSAFRELAGIFIDDEFLAVAILVVVALAAGFAFMLGAPHLLTGALLLFGCVAVLVSSCIRASRKR